METSSPGITERLRQRVSRRAVLKGGAGALAAGALVKLGMIAEPHLFDKNVPPPPSGESPTGTQTAQQPNTKQPPEQKTPTPPQENPPATETANVTTPDETPQPQATAPEEVDEAPDEAAPTPETKADREAAMHLRRIYRDHMDGKYKGPFKTAPLSKEEQPFKTDKDKLDFFKEITHVARRLNPNNPRLAYQIAAMINAQSGFSPQAEVKIGDTRYIGFLGLSEKALDKMGITPEQLMEQATPVEQLQFLEIHLREKQEAFGKPLDSMEDIIAATVPGFPVDEPYDTELFPHGTKRYERYAAYDRNRDGKITSGEFINSVIDEAVQHGDGESRENLFGKHDRVPEFEPIATPEVFVQTALDIQEIVEKEFGGKFWDRPDMDEKVAKGLRKLGYSEEQIQAFITRRATSVVDHTNPDGTFIRATECLGFVGVAATTWANASPETTLRFTKEGEALGTAGRVNDIYENGKPLQIGAFTFRAIGKGPNAGYRPGDIAVCGSVARQEPDHIGIVYTVPKTPGRMFLLESNGYLTATITKDRTAPDGVGLYADGFTFYRLQTPTAS